MSPRPHIQDLAVELAGAKSTPEALAEAATLQGLMFAATLLQTGPVTLGPGWLDRAANYVILVDPVPGKTFGDGARFHVVTREEADMKPWVPPEAR